MTEPTSATPLVCPGCGSAFGEQERFCPDCKLPLTIEPPPGGLGPVSDRHAWARKIKPQLAEGSLVRVAGARNQAEAEFIQGMLLEEGIPSVQRRSRGFDVPDFLAAGPRDVLVPQSGAMAAREVLLEAEIVPAHAQASSGPAPGPVALALLGLVVLIALVAWLGTEVIG